MAEFHRCSGGPAGELNVRTRRRKGKVRGNVLGGKGFENVDAVRMQFFGFVLGNIVNLSVDDEVATGSRVGGFSDNVKFPNRIYRRLADEQRKSERQERQSAAQHRNRHAKGHLFTPSFPAAGLVHSADFAQKEIGAAASHGRVEHWPPAHPAITGLSVCADFAESAAAWAFSARSAAVGSAQTSPSQSAETPVAYKKGNTMRS